MSPFWISVILVIGFITAIILIVLHLKTAKRKQINDLRKDWGRPRTQQDEIREIERYQQYLEEETPLVCLDKKTKTDLNFNSIFNIMDRTSSKVGQQYLYHRLSTPKQSLDELLTFNRTVEQFKNDTELRENIQTILASLNQIGWSREKTIKLRNSIYR